MRVIFMGTPDFAVPALQALVDSAEHEVIAAYSQPPRPAGRGLKETPSPVQLLAEKHSIPVFTPTSLKTPEAQEQFRAHAADVAVVVAYGLLLPQAILEAPKHGCINIHPSALPRWRGAAPLQRTIMAGDPFTEICIMQMDKGLDTGPVIARHAHMIAPDTTAGALHDTLSEEAPPLLLQVLHQLERGTAQATAQPEDGITYADKISKAEALLDLSQPAQSVYQKILGLSPTPGAYIEHEGERIKILGASLTKKNDFPLHCADGMVYPTMLQRAGKKRMGIEEFLAGFKA
jgi:methionyl-tRNA formyltransferase